VAGPPTLRIVSVQRFILVPVSNLRQCRLWECRNLILGQSVQPMGRLLEGGYFGQQMQVEGGKQALPKLIGGKIGGTERAPLRFFFSFQYDDGI
jgi:hypothetical protein